MQASVFQTAFIGITQCRVLYIKDSFYNEIVIRCEDMQPEIHLPIYTFDNELICDDCVIKTFYCGYVILHTNMGVHSPVKKVGSG